MLRLLPVVLAASLFAAVSTPATEFQVTNVASNDARPAWCPDLTQIAFDSDRAGNRDLWMVPPTGGTAVQLTSSLELDQHPDWSPDATQIVFSASVGGGNPDLYIYDVANGTSTLLHADAGAVDRFPAWSPDGAFIAWSKDADIYVIPAGGGTPVQVTTDPGSDLHPTWSPDGTEIAFLSNRAGNNDIWRISSGGGTATQVTTNTANDGAPDWSPNGNDIAFQSNRAGNNDIWIIPAAGGAATQVTTSTGNDVQPEWANNGNQLTFSRGGNIFTKTFTGVDLFVQMAASATTLTVGQQVTFTVTATNQGPDVATNIVISDSLPLGLDYTTDLTSGGSYASGTGEWTIPSLAALASETLELTATVAPSISGFGATNVATLLSVDQVDGNPFNNQAAIEVLLPNIDLGITKTVDNPLPNEGDTINYTIIATNLGPGTATSVEITDLLPAGVTFVNAIPTQGTYDDVTGLWSAGSIVAGAALTITATVDAGTAGQTIVNTAGISFKDQVDSDPLNDSDDASFTVQSADLSLVASANDLSPDPGEIVELDIVLANAGPFTAVGVQVTNAVPAGLEILNATTTQGTWDQGTGVWSVGNVVNSNSETLSITARIDNTAGGTSIVNSAAVTAANQADPLPADNSDSVTFNVNVGTKLVPEDQITATTFNDQRPAWCPDGTEIVFDSNRSGNLDLWTIASDGSGTPLQLTANLDVDQHAEWSPDCSKVVFAARVGGGNIDLYVLDRQTLVTTLLHSHAGTDSRFPSWSPDGTQIAFAKLGDIYVLPAMGGTAVQVTTDPGNDTHPTWSPSGAEIAFLSNRTGNNDIWRIPTGGGAATQVTTNTANDGAPDWSPDGTTIAMQSNRGGGNDIWTIPAAGGAATQLTNTPTNDVQPDWAPNGNQIAFARDGEIWAVNYGGVDVSLKKMVDNATPDEGGAVVFSVVAMNMGPDDATGVVVTDSLPAGLTFVGATSTTGSYSSGTGEWTIGNLAYGAVDTLTVTATVDGGTAGTTITNVASVTAVNEADGDAFDDTASVGLDVRVTDLAVDKTVDDATPGEGDTVVYTVVVTDDSGNGADSATILDALPAGVTYVSSSATNGSYNDATGEWTLGAVAASASDTLSITATVDAGTAGSTITNTASLQAAVPADNDGTDDSASVGLTVAGPAVVEMQLTATGFNDQRPAWCPDGMELAFDSNRSGNIDLWTMPLDTLTPIQLTTNLDVDQHAEWNPDCTQIAFAARNGGGNIDIYVLERATLATTLLHADGTSDSRFPSWSPDGTQIAFAKLGDIYVMPAVGGAAVQVTTDPGNDTHPTWSPDGTELAFLSNRTGNNDIWRIPVGGGVATQVTTNTANDGAPDWSPDGTTIAMQSNRGGNNDIWTIPAAGGTATQWTTTPDNDVQPEWAPSGNEIAFARSGDLWKLSFPGVGIRVTKDVDDATPGEGDTLNFTVTARNLGPDDASGLTLADSLPAGLTFVTSSATAGSYDDGTGIWTIGSQLAGVTDSLTITATVDGGTGGTTITNTASVASVNEDDGNSFDDTASASVEVQAIDIAVTKVVDDLAPAEGDTVTYTIVAANSGPSDATTATITDVLPAGVTFASSSATNGSYDDGTGEWALGTLANATTDTLTITATVDAGTDGQIIANTASLTAATPTDTNAGNDSGTASITVTGALVTEMQLTATGFNDQRPAWCSDGKEIAFDSNRAGNIDLWTLPLATGTPIQLTSNLDVDQHAEWNPDCTQIAFAARVGGGNIDIYVVERSTLATTLLHADGSSDSRFPSWSPDGSQIAFAKLGDIYVMPAAGGTAVQVTTDPGNDTHPTWSPDGTEIAFLSNRSGNNDIWRIPAGGGVATQITTNAANDGAPDWSPDGTTIALQSNRGGNNDIWTIPAAGGTATQWTTTPDNDVQPEWAPSGNEIAFARSGDLWKLTFNGVGIRVKKMVDDASPNEGDTINFTVTASNLGPDAATGVAISDLLPAGLTYVSSSATTGSYNDGTGEWSIGAQAAGAHDSLTITVTVDGGTGGTTITNTASLANVNEIDGNPFDDSSSASVDVQATDIAVTKDVDNLTPAEGDTITYTIVAANGGPNDATAATITDVLPAGITFVSSSATNGSYNDGTGEWTLGALASAASDTLTITATVDGGTDGQIIANTASLTTASPADTNAGNDSGSASLTVTGALVTEMQLTATGFNDQRPAWCPDGKELAFDSNRAGNIDLWTMPLDTLTPIQLTSNLDVDQHAEWNPDCTQIAFAARNGGGNIDIYVLERATLATTLLHSDGGSDSRFPSWSPDGTQIAFAKLGDIYVMPATGGTAVQVTTDPGNDTHPTWSPDGAEIAFLSNRTGNNDIFRIPAGGGVATQITTNTANDGAPDWSPDGTTIAIQSNRGGNNDIWTIPAAGGTATQWTTTPDNDVQPEWAPSGNEIAFARSGNLWKLTFDGVGIRVKKMVDDSTPNEGDTVNFTVTAANLGPDDATGVSITDVLPAGLTYVSSSATTGSYNDGTGEWAIGAQTAGAHDSLTITVTVDAGTGGTTITNTASLANVNEVDGNPFDDASSASIDVQALVDLALAKTVDLSPAIEGSAVQYTVVLANNGPGDATGVQVTDALPAGVTFVSSSATSGSYEDGTGIWTVGAVANAVSDTLTISATVDGGTAGTTITNTAAVTAVDQSDTDGGNDSSSADVLVPVVDLAVAKTVDNGSPNEGDTVTYTVVLANNGPDAASGVTVADTLPAGVTFVSSSATAGAYDDGTGIWTIGAVANAVSDTLTITATVDGGTAGQTITNTASLASSDQTDSDAGNDSAFADVTVQSIDLAVAKTVDNGSPNEGDTVAYTVVLTNNGPDAASGVTVADTLPAGVTFVTSSATTGSYDDGTGIWTIGAVANAVSDTLTITATVDGGTAGQTITNTASLASSDQTDSDAGNDSASADITVQSIDLAVSKTVDNGSPNEGDTVAYAVVLTNNGPDAASGVTVADTLPAGVTFVSSSATAGAYDDGTGIWTIGAVANAVSDTLTITATVDGGTAGTTITNTASLTSSDQTDSDAGNDSSSADITVQSIDLAVGKSVDNASPNEGDTVTYTVVLSNNGPDAASGVTVADTLPAGVTFVTSSATTGSYDDGTGIWTIGAVTNAVSDTLTITATVDGGTSGQTITNTASLASSDQTDSDAGNNSASADITVQSIDLAVAKSVDNGLPNEGDTVTYTVVLTNNGPDGASGVTVADTLPAGVTFISSSATTGSYDDGTGIWTTGAVANAVSDTLTITATVDGGTAGQTITNTASLASSDQTDSDAGNNSASADVTVQSIDLAVAKTVDNNSPNEGDTVTYTVVLANNGPDAASGVTVADTLPAGVSFVSSSATTGAYDDGTGIWTIGAVANAVSDTLTIAATVDGGTAGQTITNTASLASSDQTDSNAGNDSASADIAVQSIDLAVAKSVDNGSPNEGDTVTYTVVLSNNGPDTASGVTVADTLPAGVTFVSSSATTGLYDDGTGIWTIGAVANAASDTLTIAATVDGGTAGQTITNTASLASSDQTDSDAGNNSASADITVQSIDLAVSKSVDNGSPNEGDAVTYTVVLTNNGPDAASGVTVTDTLPAGVSFVGSSATMGSYDDGTGIWTIGAVANAVSDTLTITTTVDGGTAGQTITNTATLASSDQTDSDAGNDSASADITVQSIDLAVAKTVDNGTPNEGDTVTYSVVLTNNGPDAASGVTVGDTLPAGVSFVSSSATTGSYDAGTGIWTIGAVANAASDTLTIAATVDGGTSGQTITNTASLASSDQTDSDAGNNSASADITVQSIDLAVSKSVDVGSPNEGDTVTYTVVLTNNGPDAASGVTVADTLPAGVTFVSNSATAGAYDDGTGIWTIGAVANAASDTLTITATVDGGTAGQTITNTASLASSDQTDSDAGNDTASADITVQSIDLAVGKSVDNASPNEGDTVAYTVVLTNNGPDAASGVTVADTLPAGVTFVSSSATTGSYDDGTGIWTIGAVANAVSDTLMITATVDGGTAGTTITNTASLASSDQTDSDTGNDSASAAVTVQSIDLAVAKTVDNGSPNEGDTVAYTVVLTNNGPDAASGVTVTDTLPAGVSFVGSSATMGSYDDGTGIWTIGAVANAVSDTLTITATVDGGTAGQTITNTASLASSDQTDSAAGNNSASADITVQSIDLAVAKTVDNASPNEGDTVTYTVVLTNNGPDAASGVTVADTLPAGVTFVSSSATTGSYDDGTGIWTIGAVANAVSDTLTITATVDGGTAGQTITNTASLASSDQTDSAAGNNSASADITVQSIDLAVSKSVDNGSPNEGDTVTYTVVITNNGPDAASGVTVADTLPAGVTFVSSSATTGSYDDGTGTWTIGAVANAVSDTLTITATVDGGTAGQTITNTASLASSDQTDSDAGNDTASADITVQSIDLAVAKTVDIGSPNEGDTVAYTVVLTNNGPDAASGVTVADTLPAGVTFVSSSTTTGSYDDGTGIWTIGAVANAVSDTLTITATVDGGTAGTTITNTASLTSSDQTDSDAGNDSSSADITIQSIDLAVAKTVDNVSPNEGDTVTYTVVLSNNGPDAASGVTVADTLPAGVTFVSSSATTGSYDDGTGIWTIGAVANAVSDTLTITATVDGGTAGQTITNTASLASSDQTDSDAGNNSASADVTVQSIDLAVAKTVDNNSPNEGDTVTYTVVLANNGPDAASGVTVADTLPAGVTFVSSSATTGSYDDGTATWTIGAVANAVSDTLTITATVDAGTSGQTITNTASLASSDQTDADAGNDSASADLTVQSVDLAVSKTVDDASPNEGDVVTYTIVATNLGPDAASGVILTDLLPAGLAFSLASATTGAYADSSGLWTLGVLAASASDTLTIAASVELGTAGTTITNTASLTASDQTDANAGNNSDSADITILGTDLQITKLVSDATPQVTDMIEYQVIIENVGALTATNVSVLDQLPTGVTFESYTATEGFYDNISGLWIVGSQSVGEVDTLFVSASVDLGTELSTITNTATRASSLPGDLNPANDAAQADITVENTMFATMSSLVSRAFRVGDPASTMSPAQIMDHPAGATITAANDIRIRIPAGLAMTWDPAVTAATITGPAAGKVASTVTFEDGNRTLVLDVTADFAAGETVTVAGLCFLDFTAVSAAQQLELEIGNDDAVTSRDDKFHSILAVGPVATRSMSIDTTPDGSEVWVVNPDLNTVSVIAGTGPNVNTLINEISVGIAPWTLAINADEQEVWVAASGSDHVYVIDMGTYAVVDSIAAGIGTYGVAFNPTGDKALVTATASDDIFLVDTATRSIQIDFSTQEETIQSEPRGIAWRADGQRAYVTHVDGPANEGHGLLTQVHAQSWTIHNQPVDPVTNNPGLNGLMGTLGHLSLGPAPSDTTLWIPTSLVDSTGAALHPILRNINVGPSGIPDLNQRTHYLAEIGTNVDAPVDIDFKAGKAYVANEGSGDVTILTDDQSGPIELANVMVGAGPIGIAASERTERLYVANRADQTVSVIDCATDLVIATIGSTTVTNPTDTPEGQLATRTFFENAFPNPMRDAAQLNFAIKETSARVTMEIYDVRGRRVRTLVDEQMGNGFHSVRWDSRNDSGRHVSPGVYFVRMAVDGDTRGKKKMTVLR